VTFPPLPSRKRTRALPRNETRIDNFSLRPVK
jgi:hypothetical protein